MSDMESTFKNIDAFLRGQKNESAPDVFIPSPSDVSSFVHREQRLITFMNDMESELLLYGRDLPLFSEVIDGGMQRKLSLTVTTADIPEELGIYHVGLHFFEEKPHPNPVTVPYVPTIFESEVPVILSVGKHMDVKTMNQVNSLLEQDQIIANTLNTLYLIDPAREPQNMIGKISVFPRQVIDPRKEVSDKEMTLKHVISEVSGDDMTLIDQSLTILEAFYL